MDEKEFLAWQKSESPIVEKKRKGFGLFKPKPLLEVPTSVDDRIEHAKRVLEELEQQKASGSPEFLLKELDEVKELLEVALKRLAFLQQRLIKGKQR